jgi:hypothetical protein
MGVVPNKKRKYTYKIRQKGPPKRTIAVKNAVLIGEARTFVQEAEGCYCTCDLHCKSYFTKHAVDGWIETVWALRENVQRQPTHNDRRIMLAKIMAEHWDMPEPRGYTQKRLKRTGHARIAGKHMCMHFFAKIMDVAVSQVTAVFHDCAALGALNFGNAQRIRRREKGTTGSEISWWLTETAKHHDPMPNRDWDRLYFANKMQAYDAYEADRLQLTPNRWGKYPLPKVSYSWFVSVWKQKHEKSIRVRGNATMFAVCPTCLTLRQAMAMGHWTNEQREQVNSDYRDHRAMVEGERAHYEGDKKRAVLEPDEHMAMAIDGADQGAFGLPYFAQQTKFSGTLEKMKQYVVGAVIHGNQHGSFLYHHIALFKRGANMTIEILHDIFTRVKRQRTAMGFGTGLLQGTIHLQVDNCWRENKNKYVLAFFSDLVWKGVFNKVYINFLPVGHTHFDPDAVFSRIAQRMKRGDVFTVEKFLEELHLSWKDANGLRATVVRMTCTAAISQYLDESDSLGTLDDLAQSNCIEIVRKMDERGGPPVIFTRGACGASLDTYPWSARPIQLLLKKIDYTKIGDARFIQHDADLIASIQRGINKFRVEGAYASREGHGDVCDSLQRCLDDLQDAPAREKPFHWPLDVKGRLTFEPGYRNPTGLDLGREEESEEEEVESMANDTNWDELPATAEFLDSSYPQLDSRRHEPCEHMAYDQQEGQAQEKRGTGAVISLTEAHSTEGIFPNTYVFIGKDGFLASQFKGNREDREFILGKVESTFKWRKGACPEDCRELMMEDDEEHIVYREMVPNKRGTIRDRKYSEGYRENFVTGKGKGKGKGKRARLPASKNVPARDTASKSQIVMGFKSMNKTGSIPMSVLKDYWQLSSVDVVDQAEHGV